MKKLDINKLRKNFETHEATLVMNNDRYTAIDWRRADGSSDYYVNYIIDKKRGSLIVSGDLGDSIATWYNPLAVKELSNFIRNNIYYYIEKIQCSSDLYVWDSGDIVQDIISNLGEDVIEEYINDPNGCSEIENLVEFTEFLDDEVCNSEISDRFIPTKDLEEVIGNIYPDYWEWLYDCGKTVSPRVYLWAIGLDMAVKQLESEGVEL